MYKALAIKEIRETWWMAALAAVFVCGTLLMDAGLRIGESGTLISWEIPRRVPFLHGDATQAGLFGFVLGGVLGLWQTLGESVQGTWVFLLHRPMRGSWIVATKLAVGLGWLSLAVALPLFLFCLWAATPGTHPSPFEWWMSAAAWRIALLSTVWYLCGFLCGVRSARWLGTRFWPVIVAIGVTAVSLEGIGWIPVRPTLVILAADILFLGCILYAARTRDYA